MIQTFFCDCSDPTSPDYSPNLNVDYCTNFDMCLGCSRAVVYEEHLPNIIYRCFQYEDILRTSNALYKAHFEVKHIRAIQVIDRFTDRSSNGKKRHAKAFTIAQEAWASKSTYLLPPLILNNVQ